MLTKLFAVLAFLLGIGGQGIFFLYLLGTGTSLLPRGDARHDLLPWLCDIGLLLLFALQHSGMARASFKRWMPVALERSIYVAMSGIVLTIVTVCWQPLPGEPLWHGPIWIVGISIAAGLGVGCCCMRFDQWTFFGLRQAWLGSAAPNEPLQTTGVYGYVRHPLMLGLLVALWAQPIMPPELLLMNVGWTIYIGIAIQLEERDLLRTFGEAYAKYRREVPALIPWKWR